MKIINYYKENKGKFDEHLLCLIFIISATANFIDGESDSFIVSQIFFSAWILAVIINGKFEK